MDVSVAVISASLGGFDAKRNHVEQSIKCDFIHYDDDNFPRRFNSLSPRLQARIPKMFAWQLSDYDIYLWVDASCRLSDSDSVKWFIKQLGDAHIAVFKHPHRNTIKEEADYLRERLELEKSGKKQKYILPRYENEDINGQLKVFSKNFKDDKLFASTALIYRNQKKVHRVMEDWWYHTSRFHSIDQLSLPYVLDRNSIKVNIIRENYLKIPYLEYVRTKTS